MMMNRMLLIDADGLLLNASVSAQKAFDWGDECYSIIADLAIAKANFDAQLDAICKAAESDGFLLCFSDRSRRYFRHDVDHTYKSNRKAGEKPLCLKDLRDWVYSTYKCEEMTNLEADDVIGILATEPSGENTIIVSVDKDMHQIPGLHLNPMKLDEGVYEITEIDAERHVWFQVLCGDSIDGYPGCPGVGAVTANRILDKAEEDEVIYEEAVWKAFDKKGVPLHVMVTQYNLARILQWKNQKDGKPILWTPTPSILNTTKGSK